MKQQRGWRMLLLVATVVLTAMLGCSGGGGFSSLTGGSVPIGTSRLEGIVVRADNLKQTVPGASVSLILVKKRALRLGAVATPRSGETASRPNGRAKDEQPVPIPAQQPPPPVSSDQGASGSGGTFEFAQIPGGTYLVAIQPFPGSDLRDDWAWTFDLPDMTNAYMVAALWPNWFDPKTLDHVTLAPTSITLRVGESVRFVGTAYDKNNKVIPLNLSFLLEGSGIGILNPDGTFQAIAPGKARITAWMNGQTMSAPITVIP